MRKRKAKKGFVYLLKSNNVEHLYKYGCTTLTPEKRCKKINSGKEGIHDFEVIASVVSKDIFNDEIKVKCDILPCGIGYLGEIFDCTDFDFMHTEDLVINKFHLILGAA